MDGVARERVQNPVVLFDGVCNVCNQTVQWIIRNDPKGQFRFASLQSDVAEALLKDATMRSTLGDSMILIEDKRIYMESTAALRICRRLAGWRKGLYVFILIPSFLRNRVYRWFARHRYRWFGKQDQCMLPTPEIRSRFLDQMEGGKRPE
ncbi:thiol-disulfide oxidoreductase DCC family protein [Melghirimyces algeriensis]|uniref:Predicted thiol-disulfide oxidoreductase YuxK, DCC family n=1 Tax=Melghirimyces algeriensis TaxID=910412 RepID=A0A521EXN1_9BACL|nr:thiol-disulfide oxidoreductase DCC family protein [Melghirimyces algeriensis]SMO88698.1 Predicted thiol-disulfide oxidoreductase YuxK, DCC family [Melghirimyces algeriensis]